MKLQYVADRNSYKRMTNSELREAYVVEDLFSLDAVALTYTDVDRAVIGSAVPVSNTLPLPTHKELAAAYFAERREIGVLNIGGLGSIRVDGEVFNLGFQDSLYIGRGSQGIEFASEDASNPAKFYFVSYPAHTAYPTTLVPKEAAKEIVMGGAEGSNQRIIRQAIRPGIVESCQLVMGFTALDEGSVWNTMAPHTHKRRSEIYMYFDLQEDKRVFHFMGEPEETRSLVMKAGEAIISPSWSIHSGAGMSNYTFCWAMGGENQVFEDMDGIEIARLG